MVPIIFDCKCGRTIRAREELAGMRVKCPDCKKFLRVPKEEGEEEERVEKPKKKKKNKLKKKKSQAVGIWPNGLAKWSMIFSLLGLCPLPLLGQLISITLAIFALLRIKQDSRWGGKGQALFGLFFSCFVIFSGSVNVYLKHKFGK